jgi:hypothetical protein
MSQVLARFARVTFKSQLPPTIAAAALSLTYLANVRQSYLLDSRATRKLNLYLAETGKRVLDSANASHQVEVIRDQLFAYTQLVCQVFIPPTQWYTYPFPKAEKTGSSVNPSPQTRHSRYTLSPPRFISQILIYI